MVRAVWICLFFVAVLDADPVTWTVSTPRGPVEITVQQASDERLPYTNKHSVKLSGVVANKTTVDFALAEFKPVIVLKNGSVLKDALSWDIFERPLSSGSSAEFHIFDPLADFGLSDIASITWQHNIRVALGFGFKTRSQTKQIGAAKVTASIAIKCVALTTENNSGSPLEIVWDETSIIDVTREAQRVFHVGVKYSEREKSQPNTVIPPMARIEDEITPSQNASFVEGDRYSAGEWVTEPLIVSSLPIENLDKATLLAGAKVGLFLQMLCNGQKTPLIFTVEVQAVSSGSELWTATSPRFDAHPTFR
jgi:hypothetical protein